MKQDFKTDTNYSLMIKLMNLNKAGRIKIDQLAIENEGMRCDIQNQQKVLNQTETDVQKKQELLHLKSQITELTSE